MLRSALRASKARFLLPIARNACRATAASTAATLIACARARRTWDYKIIVCTKTTSPTGRMSEARIWWSFALEMSTAIIWEANCKSRCSSARYVAREEMTAIIAMIHLKHNTAVIIVPKDSVINRFQRKDRMACEHLSNICALTLYSDGIACMFFMHTPMAPVWLFYNKQNAAAVTNNTISERYSLKKGDNVRYRYG